MKFRIKIIVIIAVIVLTAAGFLSEHPVSVTLRVLAQATPTPAPGAAPFDQKAAIAKLREQIKGKENELAPAVFKNTQTMKNTPAGRLLAVMEMGFARSLRVDCTHCHIPDIWEAEDKPQKQIAHDMLAIVSTLNKELLRN